MKKEFPPFGDCIVGTTISHRFTDLEMIVESVERNERGGVEYRGTDSSGRSTVVSADSCDWTKGFQKQLKRPRRRNEGNPDQLRLFGDAGTINPETRLRW